MMLEHIRVVDLTKDLGSYAGTLLARLGANVVQGAAPTIGDPAQVEMARHGKHLVAPEDLIAVIERADILLRGPEPLSPELAAARHPRLIEVTIQPFDAGGTNQARPATDLTILARSGLMTIVGDPDRPPLTLPGQQAWALAGIQGAIAALVALNARAADGLGQAASVSAYRSAVLANYREPLMWEWAGRVGTRTGNLLVRGKSGVRQIWPCADGYVTWSFVDNPPMMRAMVGRLVGDAMAGLLADVDWDAVLVADTPRETLVIWEELVAAWLGTKAKVVLTGLSNTHGMGLSVIADVGDVLVSDHLAERGLWEETEVAGQTVRVPGPLFRESGA